VNGQASLQDSKGWVTITGIMSIDDGGGNGGDDGCMDLSDLEMFRRESISSFLKIKKNHSYLRNCLKFPVRICMEIGTC
jgi:hypothetical protein